ncbi:MAG: hypothetical protein J3R72DRAFT_453603 [Linnemannia gamsii]|nr:MAG: hypothetical protein J3R72DRAFT_453589 [Linnemannia gamsii]KAK3833206.1 MAG: hypothetical protein J3R72DRAFT_453603 [Linnemannia gamsii]
MWDKMMSYFRRSAVTATFLIARHHFCPSPCFYLPHCLSIFLSFAAISTPSSPLPPLSLPFHPYLIFLLAPTPSFILSISLLFITRLLLI